MAVCAGNGIPDPKGWEAPSDLGRSGRHHATIITTKKYFYYVSNEERMAHKIKMAIQGFSDSGQNVKTIKDSSIVPAGYMHDSMGYVYYGCYTKQETVRKDSIL